MLTSFVVVAATLVSVVIGTGLGEPIAGKLLDRLSDSSIVKHRQSSWGNKSERSSDDDTSEGGNAASQNSTLDGKATSAAAASSSSGIKGQETTAAASRKTAAKKGRRHKAIVINYPFLPRQIPFLESNYPAAGQDYRKKYDDSNIYYIRLPPTPYMYVPGLGYVSQPPKYSPPPFAPHPQTLMQQHHHTYQQRFSLIYVSV